MIDLAAFFYLRLSIYLVVKQLDINLIFLPEFIKFTPHLIQEVLI